MADSSATDVLPSARNVYLLIVCRINQTASGECAHQGPSLRLLRTQFLYENNDIRVQIYRKKEDFARPL